MAGNSEFAAERCDVYRSGGDHGGEFAASELELLSYEPHNSDDRGRRGGATTREITITYCMYEVRGNDLVGSVDDNMDGRR